MDEYSLDRTLHALSDPTRRAILGRLARADARVTDLAAAFPISLNSVSKHIRILERASLVRRRVAGRDHHLSLDPAPLDAAGGWIAAQQAAWAARLDRLGEVLDAQDGAKGNAP